MASNSQLPPASKLSSGGGGAIQSPSSQIASSNQSAGVSVGQQRAGGSGSHGAGSNTRSGSHSGAARNRQGLKGQHKGSKRYKLADEDALTETAVMRSINGRKGQTSITHLMNFSLPPRPSYNAQRDPHHRRPKRNPAWGMGSGYHAVDKARYVHANYRFIVDPRNDYHAQSVDADEYLDWNAILQILASPQSQSASCPICLGDPVAPRMAKCGHMFCLSCLIRYMHSTEDAEVPDKRPRWKSCPLCWDSIYISDTRPVRWYSGQEGEPPLEGGDIVLRLVMRPADSTLALPKEVSQSMGRHDEIPWHFAADVMDFARVMRGTEDYMMQSFDEEIEQLKLLQKHDELMFGEDVEWTSRAMRAVHDAKEKIKDIGNAEQASHKPDESKRKTASTTTTTAPNPEDSRVSALSSSLAEFRSAQSNPHPSSTPSDYYFYQALLHYYLSPLDIRILRTAFGDFSQFPSTILPRIERISTGHVVDDELRRRAKYLAHLPHGCEVSFLECDWTDTVDAATLAKFKPDIDRRRRRNAEKDTREEKERVRAEDRERQERMAQARSSSSGRRPDTSDMFRADDFAPLGTSPVATQQGSPGSQGLESTSPIWQSGRRQQQGSAFASLASPSTSPQNQHQRTVWGTHAVAPLSPPLEALGGPAVDDGWLQGWERELMAEDELVAQVAAQSLSDSQRAGESSAGGAGAAEQGLPLRKSNGGHSTGNGGGKKKKHKITLMSTNARRGA